MCLAVPGRVVEMNGPIALVDFGGVRRRIAVSLTPQVQVGEFVLVHAGYAIQVVDVEEAERQLELIREVYAELGDEPLDGEQGNDA